MKRYLITFDWLVPIHITATAEITAESEEKAERLFLATGGDPRKMTNLEVDAPWVFDPAEFIYGGHPIEVEEIEEVDDAI